MNNQEFRGRTTKGVSLDMNNQNNFLLVDTEGLDSKDKWNDGKSFA